jgi:hypothetical protein
MIAGFHASIDERYTTVVIARADCCHLWECYSGFTNQVIVYSA